MKDIKNKTVRFVRQFLFLKLCFKYRQYTLASWHIFWCNMKIVDRYRHLQGCVVETGVWRGGMSAGISEVLGNDRHYYLFDSFEGLPPATERDGQAAKEYQLDKNSPKYHDNCAAEIQFARSAMTLAKAKNFSLVEGWFEDTITNFVPPEPIAVLRLDGDWYDSTMIVLQNLYQYLVPGGLIIVDDYYAWDGCSAAVHDFICENQINARIHQVYGICVLSIDERL